MGHAMETKRLRLRISELSSGWGVSSEAEAGIVFAELEEALLAAAACFVVNIGDLCITRPGQAQTVPVRDKGRFGSANFSQR